MARVGELKSGESWRELESWRMVKVGEWRKFKSWRVGKMKSDENLKVGVARVGKLESNESWSVAKVGGWRVGESLRELERIV